MSFKFAAQAICSLTILASIRILSSSQQQVKTNRTRRNRNEQRQEGRQEAKEKFGEIRAEKWQWPQQRQSRIDRTIELRIVAGIRRDDSVSESTLRGQRSRPTGLRAVFCHV
jgi:hypothetical protein